MAENILAQAFQNLITGNPQVGRGLLSPANIAEALKMQMAPMANRGPVSSNSPLVLPQEVGATATPGMGIPSLDLGRIDIIGAAPAQAAMPPIPASVPLPQQSQQPTTTPAQKESVSSPKNNAFMDFLKQMGVPLAGAAIGGIFPDALPGASGFVQGYEGAKEKEREFERKKEIAEMGVPTYTFDPDTGTYEETGVRIPKNAKLRNLTSKEKLGIFEKLAGAMNLTDQEKKEMGINIPQSKSTETIKEEVSSKVADVNIKTREEAIDFLRKNGKAVSENNINRIINAN